MLDKIRSTVRHTLFYAIGNIAPKLSGFVLLPIYTKLLTVSDYGVLGVLELFEMLCVQLLSFGMPQTLLRWYGLAKDEQSRKTHAFTIVFFVLILVAAANCVILPWRNEIGFFLFEGDFGGYLLILIPTIGVAVINRISLTLLRSEQRSLSYSITVGGQFLVNLAANLFFVAFLKLGIKGVLLSNLTGTLAIFLILLPFLLSRIKWDIRLPELGDMVKFGFPMVFAAISGIVLNIGDRYVLQQLATDREVGQYTLVFKFASIMKLALVDAFALGLPAIGWHMIRDSEQPKRFFSMLLTYLTFALLGVGLIMSIFLDDVMGLLVRNQGYFVGDDILPLLLLAQVLVGMQRFFQFQLEIPKKTHYIALVICSSAAINIVLNFVLIPRFSILGVAFANLISQGMALVLFYLLAQRFFTTTYESGRLLTLFAVSLLLYGAWTLSRSFDVGYRPLNGLVTVLAYPAILYSLGFFHEVEIDRIKSMLVRWPGNRRTKTRA